MGDTINRRGVGFPRVPATGFAPMTTGTFQDSAVPTMAQLVAPPPPPLPVLTPNGNSQANANQDKGWNKTKYGPMSVL